VQCFQVHCQVMFIHMDAASPAGGQQQHSSSVRWSTSTPPARYKAPWQNVIAHAINTGAAAVAEQAVTSVQVVGSRAVGMVLRCSCLSTSGGKGHSGGRGI
jgi:hypothetical protein